jgi:hypothetical protein
VNKLLLALILVAPGLVRAQEAYIPPPIVAPPPYQPFRYQTDQELSARGHRNKVAGGVLIGLGSAAIVAGAAMTIFAATHPEKLPEFTPQYCFQGSSSCGSARRYDVGLIAGGLVTSIAGFVMNAVGIPVYAVGGSQMKKARFRLQASAMRLEF